ncbi:MAG: DNA polymerase II [Lentisphaeria bacterium]|nr:DNA polymerase II [Lentisphaeria bacterium]
MLMTEPIRRICAVEPAKDGSAEVFIRHENDTVERRILPFRPFLLTAFPAFPDDFAGMHVTELSGPGDFRYQVEFDHSGLYEEALAMLKKTTGFSGGQPNAPFRLFSDLTQQFLIQHDLRLFSGMAFPEVRRLQFDIETLCSPGYEFPNADREGDAVIIITLSDSTGWEKVLSLADYPSEKELIEAFCTEVMQRDPDILEGHNIFRFDLPYLETRAKRYKLKLKLGRDGSAPKKRSSRFSVAERIITYTRYDVYGRHVADTCFLLYFYDAVHRNLDSYGLKYAARHFGVAAPDRTYIEGTAITDAWAHDRENLLKYALDDVRETRSLSAILSPSWFYQTQIVPFSYQNCMVRGNATRIDSLFAAEYLKAGAALPSPERGRTFAGALTQAVESGVFERVDHCDVRSLYPSVILSEGWVPARDSLQIFPQWLKKLRAFRLEAKDAAKNAETPEKKDYYGALQSAFKILINSFYGYLGFEQGFLNDFNMAERVTSRGREILTLMLNTLEKNGSRIIEMDTDGIYFQLSKGKTLADIGAALKEALPEGIEVDFDESYPAMFCYKSKNYALLTAAGEITITGAALKSRGLEPFQRRYMLQMIEALLRHDDQAPERIHAEFSRALNEHALPFSDLAKSETLADSPETYKRKLASGTGKRSAAYELAIKSGREYRQGDQVTFYITGDKKRVSVVDSSKLLSEADDAVRDENVPYYSDKLEELRKKFAPFFVKTDDLFAGM